MKVTLNTFIKTSFFLIATLALSACGQKGPLEIEQPIQKQEQEEDQAPTI